MNGYAVMKGSEVEISNALQRYNPWFVFKVKQVGSLKQVEEGIKALTK
jgi:hypothetical protein